MKNTYLLVILLLVIIIGGVYIKFIHNNNLNSSISKAVIKKAPTPTSIPKATPTPSTNYEDGMKLQIISPKDGSSVSQSQVTLSGQTSPSAEVFVDSTKLIADAKGNFTTTLDLDEGENMVIIDVNDAYGNNAEKDITVTYKIQ